MIFLAAIKSFHHFHQRTTTATATTTTTINTTTTTTTTITSTIGCQRPAALRHPQLAAPRTVSPPHSIQQP
jgi:hypothetical protein